jgi:threonine dehydrogenase-like Zn-dependent dehydrogenase
VRTVVDQHRLGTLNASDTRRVVYGAERRATLTPQLSQVQPGALIADTRQQAVSGTQPFDALVRAGAALDGTVPPVRFTGGIGTIGVYVPQDPGGPNELAKHGKAPFDFGDFWFKGQHMGTGQCPVKRYNRYLRSFIAEGQVKPSWIVSHDLPLDQAAEAYKHFDVREEGWTKVVLHPGQAG